MQMASQTGSQPLLANLLMVMIPLVVIFDSTSYVFHSYSSHFSKCGGRKFTLMEIVCEKEKLSGYVKYA